MKRWAIILGLLGCLGAFAVGLVVYATPSDTPYVKIEGSYYIQRQGYYDPTRGYRYYVYSSSPLTFTVFNLEAGDYVYACGRDVADGVSPYNRMPRIGQEAASGAMGSSGPMTWNATTSSWTKTVPSGTIVGTIWAYPDTLAQATTQFNDGEPYVVLKPGSAYELYAAEWGGDGTPEVNGVNPNPIVIGERVNILGTELFGNGTVSLRNVVTQTVYGGGQVQTIGGGEGIFFTCPDIPIGEYDLLFIPFQGEIVTYRVQVTTAEANESGGGIWGWFKSGLTELFVPDYNEMQVEYEAMIYGLENKFPFGYVMVFERLISGYNAFLPYWPSEDWASDEVELHFEEVQIGEFTLPETSYMLKRPEGLEYGMTFAKVILYIVFFTGMYYRFVPRLQA